MKFVLVLVSLALLVSLASVQGNNYCGRHLSETLAYMCPELEGASKRSGAMGAAAMYGTRGWRWAAMGGNRGKRGVVEECCYQSCTLDELLTYC
uniref:Bombyxin-related peptide B n=1 Tax=Agrius convolvuli TaxID=55055 RepID=BXRB_AGRCO|nr:RecName: Full=Bombyxin-related peptide B; AltName: Full=ABRP; Contains: RecName: Full=Bombyxin-related peptide B chain B; Contains: RecName: Full=Bombyxin-related peptide B chain A; Flags: Precursor [Agrius convolvuli]BAA20092.1 prepro-Agrius bombyxin-related peptide B [Agrius convolvuli]prf//2209332B bombyxin-related peptide:ISOTYPE=B [Agrius convolvuli]